MVNEIHQLFKALKQAQVELFVKDGQLRSRAPKGAITPALGRQIRLYKTDIIELIEQQQEELNAQYIPNVAQQESYALSNAQRRLWIPDQLAENMVAYNMPTALEITGSLKVAALQEAFETLLHRHEILRTRLVDSTDGTPRQVIDPKQDFELTYRDFTAQSAQETTDYVLENHVNHVFDLSQDSLMRVELLKVENKRHLLLLNMHHIISDGWSMGVVFKELAKLYTANIQGIAPELPPLRIQYKDYCAWQDNLLSNERKIKQLRDFWQTHLAAYQTLELPTDFVRPTVQTYEGDHYVYSFEPEILSQLEDISRKAGASLFMTLTALVKILLYRYTNQEDIVMGTGIAGRNHPDLYDQIGFFVNTLVLRNQLDGADTFEQTLAKIKKTTLAAFEHDAYPFDRMVEELELERDLSRNPIFDAFIILQNTEAEDLKWGDLDITPVGNEFKTSKFDLAFVFQTSGDHLHLTVEYSTNLFKTDRIERMVQHLETLINSLAKQSQQNISQLNILPVAEKQLIVADFNNAVADYPQDKTIIDLFEEQVEKNGDATAVIFENNQLTYNELNQKANQVGHYLREKYQIQPDDIIALQLERSEWMIIAMLGVMKAGASYLPIAPDFPLERVRFMLEDSKAKALIRDISTFDLPRPRLLNFKSLVNVNDIPILQIEKLSDTFEVSDTSHNPKSITTPKDLAYIIYTSGSTGQPKGTMLEHQGLVNMSLNQVERFDLTEKDHILQFANYIFDASVYEIQMTFFAGATLVLASKDTISNPETFSKLLAEQQVSVVVLPPIFLAGLEQKELPSLRLMVTAGEAPNQQDIEYYSQRLRYINAFGPTECSVCISTYEVPKTPVFPVPVGQPVANMRLYILDKNQEVQPIGIAGELCASGPGLARGYLNQEALTDEKFIPNPFVKGERLYRTGDLARWLPDGNIDFLGRIDYQLKIRGYRIEAGEIEQAMLQHPAIKNVVVMGNQYQNEKVLQAFFVPDIHQLEAQEQEAAQSAVLHNWQEIFDSSYDEEGLSIADFKLDISGWGNSYTNAPIPAEEMRAWADHTSERIKALQPQKVMEVGVGTGMFLARIAPEVETYLALDVSPQSVAKVARLIQAYPELNHAEVEQAAAHELPETPVLDTIIINSVVQYFPNQNYLTEVLLDLIDRLEEGGKLFVGDVRNYPLLRAFHAEVKYHQLLGSSNKDSFLQALNDAVDSEKELTVAPAYFYQLEQLSDRPLKVTIELKEGDYVNELSQYRYDVTIKVGESASASLPLWQDWQKEKWTLEKVEKWLNERPAKILALKNIPNFKTAKGTKAVDWVNGKIEAQQLSGFKNILAQSSDNIPPNAFWKLVETTNFQVKINWSADANSGCFDVLILPKNEQQHFVFPIEQQAKNNLASQTIYCNFPMQNELRQRLMTELRAHLSQQLPDYMIPQYFIPLNEMPLTPSKKVDRKALPSLESMSLSLGVSYVAPRNQTEAVLVEIWEEVLQRVGIGVKENFFDLGGHSLRAIRANALIYQRLAAKVSLSEFFAHPTIEALSQIIKTRDSILFQAIEPIAEHANGTQGYELSNAQRRLWVLDQLENQTAAYNMPAYLFLEGQLDKVALEKAFQSLVDRHEILRTRFEMVTDGTPYQMIEQAVEFKLICKDWKHKTATEQEAYRLQFGQRGFDLSKGNLLRAELMEVGQDQHVLLLNMHHIISDGWSMGILMKELSTVYEVLTSNNLSLDSSNLTPLSIQYKDYAAWQNNLLHQETVIGKLQSYWQKQVEDLPTLDLPLDYPRPTVKTFNGASLQKVFSKNLSEQLNNYVQENGATLFIGLTALVKTLLYRYTNQEDIVIGTPTAGRTHPDLHHQIGFYLNTLVLRSQIEASDTFGQFLQKVKTTALGAFEHELYPFDRLVEEMDIPRDLSRSVAFDVQLVLQNNEAVDFQFAGLKTAPLPLQDTHTKFDLNLHFNELEQGLHLLITYNTDIFKASRIERMFDHLETLLTNIFRHPERPLLQHQLVPSAERQLIVKGFNQTKLAFPREKTLANLFEEQVEKTPDNVAIVCDNRQLTYHQLNEKANQVAHYLLEQQQIQQDDIVALLLDRNEWIIAAFFGIHKAGAAYLPISKDFPNSRIEFMLENSGAKLLLTNEDLLGQAENLATTLPKIAIENIKTDKFDHPNIPNIPHQLAYLLYTSGSTGQPKSVMVEQHSIVNSLYSFKQKLYNQYEGYLNVASTGTYTFDASMRVLIGSLLCGHTMHIIGNDLKMQGNTLFQYLAQKDINIIDCTPTLLNIWLTDELKIQQSFNLKNILIAGEKLTHHLLERLYAIPALMEVTATNLYGPTETTLITALCNLNKTLLPQMPIIPVGQVLPNYQVLILNANKQLAPIGVVGEICIAGEGVSRGYLNQPELTAEKFIPHPFEPNKRLYTTGDKGRWLEDGSIDIVGRVDFQLKIRGHRIETGEIETALLEHPAISAAVVVGKQFSNGLDLVAYLVAAETEIPRLESLRQFLSKRLPAYMIPAYFVDLPVLPLTRSGKVNRKMLPKPTENSLAAEVTYSPARNDLEAQLVAIWQKVLNRQHIGINDNFFDLGGHSLRVIQLNALIREQLDIQLPLKFIFQNPTIAGLAVKIDSDKISNSTQLEATIYNPKGKQTLFVFPPVFGLSLGYQPLAELMPEFKMCCFDFVVDEERLEQYYQAIKKEQPEGPYVFFGYSAGGSLAFDVARYLESKGEIVSDLIFWDAIIHFAERKTDFKDFYQDVLKAAKENADAQPLLEMLQNETVYQQSEKRMNTYRRFTSRLDLAPPVRASIHQVMATDKEKQDGTMSKDWSPYTKGEYTTYQGVGRHIEMLHSPFMELNIEVLQKIVKRIEEEVVV